MKLLITGGCGFIGSNFVRYWHTTHPKDNLTILDKLTYAGHKENVADLNDIQLIVGDICNRLLVKHALKNIDVIVHFAAESHVDRSILRPSDFIKTNALGTQVLLNEALRTKIKLFHHVSTDEIFGSLKLHSKIKFNENTPYNPSSPYSASKAAADHLVRAYYHTYKLPVTITNTSNNYGPHQDPEKLIPRFISNIILGKKVPLMGKGENVRDWIYVEDHCAAIDLIIQRALSKQDIIGETFCVGSSQEMSNLKITQIILSYFKKDQSWIEYIPHRLGHDARYAIDSSKIQKKLGWKPKYSFNKRIEQTIKWYSNNREWWGQLLVDKLDVDPQKQKKYGK